MKTKMTLILVAALACLSANAQVNSGSNGSDGAFSPTTNTVINMADHPNGIYQYTSVNIPTNVTVTFIPNANNTPVYWLVQSNVVINGVVDLSGQLPLTGSSGGLGGPGGWSGGTVGANPSSGQGPGGGGAGVNGSGGGASFGSQGQAGWASAGSLYGNSFLLPLLGGSGGGAFNYGGGGGGGAILIAAQSSMQINGAILANGGSGLWDYSGFGGGGGSGGGVRLMSANFSGNGSINVSGGRSGGGANGGQGRIRIDTYQFSFGGSLSGVASQGSQPIIFPTSGQLPQLNVTSVGGVPVSASPTGVLSTPDAVLSAQQNNPIPIVVNCANLPLHSLITVSVKPASGAAVSATGYNDTGTLSSSTATVSIVIPRGGGLIYATAATGN